MTTAPASAPTLIELYRAAKEDADLATQRSCNINARIHGAFGRAAMAAFPGKRMDAIMEVMEARAYYSAQGLGGGNPESVIMREIIEGRHTPAEWAPVYRAARGNGWSGEVAQKMVGAGFLAYQADGHVYTLTEQGDRFVIDAMASHKASLAKLNSQNQAVFQGYDAEGLAIYTNVAIW